MTATNLQIDDECDWPFEGDPPSAADDEMDYRLQSVADALDRASQFPADAAWHISTALDAMRNHGLAPLNARQCDTIMGAVTRTRPAIVAALPQFSRSRLLDGLDALIELAMWCSGFHLFGDAEYAEACRDRMRIAQNEAHNLSLLGDIAAGNLPANLRNLQRIVRNEVESLAPAVDNAGRHRAGHKRAA